MDNSYGKVDTYLRKIDPLYVECRFDDLVITYIFENGEARVSFRYNIPSAFPSYIKTGQAVFDIANNMSRSAAKRFVQWAQQQRDQQAIYAQWCEQNCHYPYQEVDVFEVPEHKPLKLISFSHPDDEILFLITFSN